MFKDAKDVFDKDFVELSPAEFFEKNKQMLGFTGKIRSLTIIFHELITNSLDATEHAGILPEINIELKELGKEHYLLKHTDNGPGIPEEDIENVYCKMFAGSKFKNIQSRGQQGLGSTGCVLLSQMTTGKPVKVISGYLKEGQLKGYETLFKMDVKRNKGIIIYKKPVNVKNTGVSIEIEFKNLKYSLSKQGAFEYMRRTVIANPHLKMKFKNPKEEKFIFKRASNKIPPIPKKVLPHPKGITTNELSNLTKNTKKRTLKTMLKTSLSRVSDKRIKEIEEKSKINLNKKPKDTNWIQLEEIIESFKEIKFMAPDTNGLVPIGEKQIEKGIKQMLKPKFTVALTRKPQTYQGIPFIIEVAIAYGGESGRKINNKNKMEILRFANSVPLTFDQGSCAITEGIKTINWKRYGIKDLNNTPITIFVNMASAQVPYMSTGKQSISPEKEIISEIRQATMKLARKLQIYLNSQKTLKEKKSRFKIFEKLVPIVLEESARLGEIEVPQYNSLLQSLSKISKEEINLENNEVLVYENIVERVK